MATVWYEKCAWRQTCLSSIDFTHLFCVSVCVHKSENILHPADNAFKK